MLEITEFISFITQLHINSGQNVICAKASAKQKIST